MPKPLHLVLKHKWYDQIDRRQKRVEYRDNTPYWRKRILKNPPLESIIFHKGYTNITMEYKINYIVAVESFDQIEIYLGVRIR